MCVDVNKIKCVLYPEKECLQILKHLINIKGFCLLKFQCQIQILTSCGHDGCRKMCYPTQTIIKFNFCFGTLNNVHIKVIVYQNLRMSCFIQCLCLFSRKFVNAFIDFPKPLIGLINGPAVGVSVTVLGLFDAVYASDKVCLYQHNSPPILQYF